MSLYILREFSVEGSGFWLPSEFLTDDAFLMEKKNNSAPASGAEFCFPTEFPYHFKPDTDENVENFLVMSTSPQSTLANMGSPNGVPSPPKTLLGDESDAVGDLISRAAGQVAMLKLSDGDRFGFGFWPGSNKDTRFMGPQGCFLQHAKPPTPSVLHDSREYVMKHQNQNCGVPYGQWQNRGDMGVREMNQAAWTIHQHPTCVGSGRRAVMLGGSGGGVAVKRACAGTGVFLPRRYENNISDSGKKPDGGSTTLIPDRAAAHALNKSSIDNITGFSRSQLPSQPMFNRGFIQDYDLLMARRHALMLRQQRSLLLAERSSMISRETCLPQEWTY